MNYTYELNGNLVTLNEGADLSRRLLDVVRDDHGLKGTKEGCAEGECGACLVFMDEEIYNSCLVPLANAIGKKVMTIEAYAKTEDYQHIAQAMLQAGGVQCGYCTPGMVMAIGALLKRYPKPTREEIKEGLSGNLCRCTGYQMIFDAVEMLVVAVSESQNAIDAQAAQNAQDSQGGEPL
jgi:carbon-monoxide dehydrogenase small subunit